MSRMELYQAIGIRVVAVAIAIAIASLLSPTYLFACVIVLGQGHFLLAYLYQYKSGHLDLRKILLLVAILGVITWCAFALPIVVAGFLTTLVFIIHFAMDEVRLMNGKYSVFTTLEFLPYVILYSAMSVDLFLKVNVSLLAIVAVLFVCVVYVALSFAKKRKPDLSSYTSLGWFFVTLVVYCLYLMSFPITAVELFLALGIVHYAIWYGFYWFKLKNKTFVQTEYILSAVIINIALALLAFFWLTGMIPALDLLFAPIAFYIWTFLHVAASIRAREWTDAVRL